MPGCDGIPLYEGDLAMWHPEFGKEDDVGRSVEVLNVLSDNRYLVKFWEDERERAEIEKEAEEMAQRDADMRKALDLKRQAEEAERQINRHLAEHGEGADALPLRSPFVVEGQELTYFGDYEE